MRKSQSTAHVRLLALARVMRRNPTASEYVLWKHFNAQQLGVSFRRQQVIGGYIVDFLARKLKLVVEVDGGRHAIPSVIASDARRDRVLRRAGYTVLRVTAGLVIRDTDAAVALVRRAVKG
jgi:very-short-patch-repair endonuclease